MGLQLKEKRIWKLMFILLWCAQMLTAVYFCCQKQGFHEDEYYTYYSTARTYGLSIEENAWMEHDAYYNEFIVLPEQRFQYGLVKQVQSWDVHPPVYYWLFHTAASLFPGKFSKWFGLVINLAAFGISIILLKILCMQVTKNNEKLSFLICFFYGFTPAALSSVVFIRMYALLTMFVLLCAILHMKAMESFSVKILIPLAVVTYLGFLTQYYYFIFLFFMAAAFCVYLLWKERSLRSCICYGFSQAAALVLAYLTYPSCLGQMFRGQRGAQAGRNFFDVSNTFMRLEFFYQLLDEYVFGKFLPVLLVAVVMMALFVNYRRRVNAGKGVGIEANINERKNVNAEMDINGRKSEAGICYSAYAVLLFTVLGYFFTVSKTGLLLGETSIRYQMPIYGTAVLLVFAALYELAGLCVKYCKHENSVSALHGNCSGRIYNACIAAVLLVSLFVNISGLSSGRVVFLYPEDEERIAAAKEQALSGTPAVYVCDENQSWCIWDAADEFFEYGRIYIASQNSTEPIDDSLIKESNRVVLYLSNTAQPQQQLRRIMDNNPNLSGYELKYREKYCDVYYLY